jgi:hypothetical protein
VLSVVSVGSVSAIGITLGYKYFLLFIHKVTNENIQRQIPTEKPRKVRW